MVFTLENLGVYYASETSTQQEGYCVLCVRLMRKLLIIFESYVFWIGLCGLVLY